MAKSIPSAELGSLGDILSSHRRNRLAALLTDEDVAMLKRHANSGMGDNTFLALASDLAYLQIWCQLAIGTSLPWPASESLAFMCIAHHLWDPRRRAARARNRSATDNNLVNAYPVAWRHGAVSHALSQVRVTVAARPHQRSGKKAINGEILTKLLETCAGQRPVDRRDQALLLTAFASGGRRRSQVVALHVEDLTDEDPALANPVDRASPLLPRMTIRLGRTGAADESQQVFLVGCPVLALKEWLREGGIKDGPVFRRIDQWGNIDRRPLTPQSVNLILMRIPVKSVADSETKPATYSDFIPATIPI